MREVYADHAGTTAPAPEVVEAMRPYLAQRFGNASSVHRRGEAAREAIETARSQVAGSMGCLPEEIVFTATGSEANNLALKGAFAAAPSARRRLVISAIEHPSIMATARHLEARGVPVSVVPVGHDGIVDLGALEGSLGADVALVSIMWVNNEVGTIQPVAEISRLAREAGALMHCDAVQAFGKIPVSVTRAGVDMMSLAAHKFRGPLGAAALFVRRRTRLVPLVHGGHQERSRRAGTENVPAIVGMGVAAKRAVAGLAAGRRRLEALGRRLEGGLTSRTPGTTLNGHPDERVPAIVNACFEGVDGEAVLHELDREGITVSTGSACSAADPGPSHVLLAMGLGAEDAHASVRFSLGAENDDDDVDRILDVVPGVVHRLRALQTPAARREA